MAKLEKMIPFIIQWETGTIQKKGETNEELWKRAKASKNGFVFDPVDTGGVTVVGVIYTTFVTYCKKKKIKNDSVDDLKKLTYDMWFDILKGSYWNRWYADQIKSQSVAEMLVDWVWASGVHGIKIPQRMLGVTDDGIVGAMTLDALNKKDPKDFFNSLVQERTNFVEGIVKRSPSQEKFLKGWKNRINDLKYED